MGWAVGDHGFDMQVSPRMPGYIARGLKPWLTDWLGQQAGAGRRALVGRTPRRPARLVGRGGVSGLAERRFAVSHEVLAECGNMSSPTVLFVLDRLRMQRPAAVRAARFRPRPRGGGGACRLDDVTSGGLYARRLSASTAGIKPAARNEGGFIASGSCQPLRYSGLIDAATAEPPEAVSVSAFHSIVLPVRMATFPSRNDAVSMAA